MADWTRTGIAPALHCMLALGGCTHAPPAQHRMAAADDLLRSGRPDEAALRDQAAIDVAEKAGGLRVQAHATYELVSLYATDPDLGRVGAG